MTKKIYKVNHLVDISNVDFLKESIDDGASTIQEGPNTYFFCKSKEELDKLIKQDKQDIEYDGLVVKETKVKKLTASEYLEEAFNDFMTIALLKKFHSEDKSLTIEESLENMKKNGVEVCEAVNNLLEHIRLEIDEEIFQDYNLE